MTTPDHGQINTRERALSSDWNRQVELGSRGLLEGLAAVVSGSVRETGVLGDTAFLVTPLDGTMTSAISPGVALFYDSTKTFPQSQVVWCESRVVRQVTHPAADGLARWDVVEMRPGSQTSSTQPRDQFDPLTGTFTVVNMVKEVQSYPQFQVRSGTPSASPGIPAGTPGWIPLAYVQVPGGAVAVDQTKVVYCRPLLSLRAIDREGWNTSTLNSTYARNVTGGGISFAGGSLTGSLVNAVNGRFGGKFHHNFRISQTVQCRVTSMTWDGGGLPGADTVVYFYAIPAPYPAGYDAQLAGRELWTPDTTNLYGTSGGFYDVSRQSGCIIIASSKAPDVSHPAGASSGTGSFSHEFFAEAGFATSAASSWVYLGSGFFELAGNQIVTQLCVGTTVATKRKPGKSFLADLPIAAPTAYNVWTQMAGADVVQWPVTARDMDLQLRIRIDPADNAKIHLTDFLGDDAITQGTYANQFSNNDAGEQLFGAMIPVVTSASGNVTIVSASSTGIGIIADIVGKCYRDAVLALR